jgi:hypothetical protein
VVRVCWTAAPIVIGSGGYSSAGSAGEIVESQPAADAGSGELAGQRRLAGQLAARDRRPIPRGRLPGGVAGSFLPAALGELGRVLPGGAASSVMVSSGGGC